MDKKDKEDIENHFNNLRIFLLEIIPPILGMTRNGFFEILADELKPSENQRLNMAYSRNRVSVKRNTNFPEEVEIAITRYLDEKIPKGTKKAQVQEEVRKNWNDEEKQQFIMSLLNTAFNNDVEELLHLEAQKRENIIYNLENPFKQLPSKFALSLDRNIAAYCSITSNDLNFLNSILNKDLDMSGLKNDIICSEILPIEVVLKSILSEEWSNWIEISKIGYSKTKKGSTSRISWGKFVNKAKKKTYIELLAFSTFFALVFANESGYQFFDEDKLDLFLLFKYFLTPGAQQRIMDSINT